VNESLPSPETPPPEFVRARAVRLPYARTPVAVSPLALPALSRREAVLDLLLVLVVGLVALVGLSLAVDVWVPTAGAEGLQPPSPGMLMVQEWFQAMVAIAILVYLLLRHNLPPAAFGLQVRQPGRQLLWGAGGLGLTYCWMIVSLLVIAAVVLLYPGLQEDLMKRKELLEVLPINSLWRTIVLMIPVAISEEIIFRGLLLPYLRRITGYWWAAVLISTGVFATLHFQQGLLGILQISGVAAIFALVFIYSRSLLATMVAHFGFNVGQVLFMRVAEDVLRTHGF
jgi:membrane protease YdiL (CAAX protease family)